MHFTCLFLFRKSFGTEKHCWISHAFRIFLVAGHQALDGWQMPGLVERLDAGLGRGVCWVSARWEGLGWVQERPFGGVWTDSCVGKERVITLVRLIA